jgi:hypothetical protein
VYCPVTARLFGTAPDKHGFPETDPCKRFSLRERGLAPSLGQKFNARLRFYATATVDSHAALLRTCCAVGILHPIISDRIERNEIAVSSRNHRHHEVFEGFRCWSGQVPSGFEADFLGSRYRTAYFKLSTPQADARYAPSYPPFDEEYFEWIDLLEAVRSARGRFTMLERGAGFGRWTAKSSSGRTAA